MGFKKIVDKATENQIHGVLNCLFLAPKYLKTGGLALFLRQRRNFKDTRTLIKREHIHIRLDIKLGLKIVS